MYLCIVLVRHEAVLSTASPLGVAVHQIHRNRHQRKLGDGKYYALSSSILYVQE